MTVLDARMSENRYRQEIARIEGELGRAIAELEMLVATELLVPRRDTMSAASRPRRIRAAGAALFAVALILAVLTALRLGRTTPTATTVGHDHGVPRAAPPDGGQPVRLPAEASRRIGVTFAEVALGPLEREVRTVAQVAYDETRVTVVAPRVEGWVEALYVNTTGQPVRRGQALFALYSPMVVSRGARSCCWRATWRAASREGPKRRGRGATASLESARRRLLAWDVPADEIAQLERDRRGPAARSRSARRSPASCWRRICWQGQRLMAGEPALPHRRSVDRVGRGRSASSATCRR